MRPDEKDRERLFAQMYARLDEAARCKAAEMINQAHARQEAGEIPPKAVRDGISRAKKQKKHPYLSVIERENSGSI